GRDPRRAYLQAGEGHAGRRRAVVAGPGVRPAAARADVPARVGQDVLHGDRQPLQVEGVRRHHRAGRRPGRRAGLLQRPPRRPGRGRRRDRGRVAEPARHRRPQRLRRRRPRQDADGRRPGEPDRAVRPAARAVQLRLRRPVRRAGPHPGREVAVAARDRRHDLARQQRRAGVPRLQHRVPPAGGLPAGRVPLLRPRPRPAGAPPALTPPGPGRPERGGRPLERGDHASYDPGHTPSDRWCVLMTHSVSAAPAPAAPKLAFGIGPDGTYTLSGQIAAFVLGVLTMLLFLPLMVTAALLYTKAETVFPHDADRARWLVNWSWISITAPVVLAVLAAPAVVLLVG